MIYTKYIQKIDGGAGDMERKKQRVFKIEDELWERFTEVCRRKDLTASQMIRHLIRHLIEIEQGYLDGVKPRRPRGRRTKRKGG